MPTQTPLTNVQRELLELFALDVPEEELCEIRRLLARHFAEKATAEMDLFCEEHGLKAGDLKQWANEHERSAGHH